MRIEELARRVNEGQTVWFENPNGRQIVRKVYIDSKTFDTDTNNVDWSADDKFNVDFDCSILKTIDIIGLDTRRQCIHTIGNQHKEKLRLSIIALLDWNDKNGFFTDADCIAEGYEPLSLAEAIELLNKVIAEG